VSDHEFQFLYKNVKFWLWLLFLLTFLSLQEIIDKCVWCGGKHLLIAI